MDVKRTYRFYYDVMARDIAIICIALVAIPLLKYIQSQPYNKYAFHIGMTALSKIPNPMEMSTEYNLTTLAYTYTPPEL